jgi:hypothetical protein
VSEVDEGEEANCAAVIPGGEAPEVLEPVDASLDLVTPFVARLVMAEQLFACSVRGDGGFGFLGLDEGAQCVAGIDLVCRECRAGMPSDRRAVRFSIPMKV